MSLSVNAGEMLEAVNFATKFMTPPKWPSDNTICNVLYLRFTGDAIRVQGMNGNALFSRDVAARPGTEDSVAAWETPVLVQWSCIALMQGVLKAKGKRAAVDLCRVENSATIGGVAVESDALESDWWDTWKRLDDTVLGNPRYIDGTIPVAGVQLGDAKSAKLLGEIFKACCPGADGVKVRKALGEPMGRDNAQFAHWEFSGNKTRVIWMAWKGDVDSVVPAKDELADALLSEDEEE